LSSVLEDTVNVSGDSDLKKTIYFAPNCTPSEPGGRTGGVNYGVLAKIPVLVN